MHRRCHEFLLEGPKNRGAVASASGEGYVVGLSTFPAN